MKKLICSLTSVLVGISCCGATLLNGTVWNNYEHDLRFVYAGCVGNFAPLAEGLDFTVPAHTALPIQLGYAGDATSGWDRSIGCTWNVFVFFPETGGLCPAGNISFGGYTPNQGWYRGMSPDFQSNYFYRPGPCNGHAVGGYVYIPTHFALRWDPSQSGLTWLSLPGFLAYGISIFGITYYY